MKQLKFKKADNKEHGQIAEDYVKKILTEVNLQVATNNWAIDFVINQQVSLEVKSCQLYHLRNKDRCEKGSWVISKDNHDTLKDRDGWYACVLMLDKVPLSLKFIHHEHAYKLSCGGGKFRHLCNHHIYKMLSLKEFIEMVYATAVPNVTN